MYQKYQEGYELEKLKEKILNDLYHIIGKSLRNGQYAFKGGYILRNLLGRDIRRTNDIDVSVLDENTFELAMYPITTYLEELQSQGIIWSYVVKSPKIKNGRNLSGGVKIYCKPGPNSAKWVLCGIDMSIKNFNGGVVLTPEGYSRYCNEYMLADKLSVLYGNRCTLIRRIRDIIDVYLIVSISDCMLNKQIVRSRLEERIGHICEKESTLEKLLREDSNIIYKELNKLLTDGKRINSNISYHIDSILSIVLKFISVVRS